MRKNIKKIFKDLREIVWPILEPLQDEEFTPIKVGDFKWNDKDKDFILEYANKHYESEENRKKEVESKATIFIGTFGVAATILTYLSNDLVFNKAYNYSYFLLLLIFIMTITVIYMCRAIWFSIKTLQRQNYYRVTFPKFMFDSNNDIKEKLIVKLYNDTSRNSKTINIKVDYMTMAQEYFKRVVFLIGLFASLVLGKYFFGNVEYIGNIFTYLKNIEVNESFQFIISAGMLILFILIVVVFRKISKLNSR